jgi:glycosyltransferase involved in cell wall biosynthesis
MLRTLQLVTTRRSFFDTQVESLERKGVDCTVVEVPQPAPDEVDGRSAADYMRFYADTVGEALQGDYDLVHANYGLVAPAALAQPTRPVVLSLWGSDIMGPAWLTRLSRTAARASSAVVVPSMAAGAALDRPHHRIPFGVDTDQFRPVPKAEARAEVGWDTDKPIVLFPYDTDREVKNYPLAERVVEQTPVDAELRTISDVPYERVPLYMNASDAVLVTSKRESGPMVVKEAAACNVPVVSATVGFAPEVLSNAARSHCCRTETEFVEALTAVLSARERSDGRGRVAQLDVDTGERLLELYRSLLD